MNALHSWVLSAGVFPLQLFPYGSFEIYVRLDCPRKHPHNEPRAFGGVWEKAVPGNWLGILAWGKSGVNVREALHKLCQKSLRRQPLPVGLGYWGQLDRRSLIWVWTSSSLLRGKCIAFLYRTSRCLDTLQHWLLLTFITVGGPSAVALYHQTPSNLSNWTEQGTGHSFLAHQSYSLFQGSYQRCLWWEHCCGYWLHRTLLLPCPGAFNTFDCLCMARTPISVSC